MNSLDQSLAYARQHQDAFLEQFREFLRIPTVSADPAYRADVQRTADWIVAELQRIGFRRCQAIPSQGHPLVYGEWLEAGPACPTLLIYAHYDTQPVDPLELWVTPPFAAAVRDGKIYARGAIDDKAGVHVNLKAAESILATSGRLPVNVKFLFEGEEESGSPSMLEVVQRYKELLKADVLIISDGGSMENEPLVFSSARGIVSAEVLVTGPVRDLHSGSYGGVVHNPAHLVGRMIAALHDENGRVQIPGFYERVRPLSPAELAYLATLEPALLAEARNETGLEHFWGLPEYTFQERQTALPTCDVNGLSGGYQGPGSKTIIPAQAGFKASMRIVADQDPEDIAEKFSAFIRSFACPTLKIEVQITSKSWPFQGLVDGPVLEAIHRSFQATYGKRATLYRQGGSVPIIGALQSELGIPLTNLGYGSGGDNGHAPNECIPIHCYFREIATAIHFFHNIAQAFPG